MSGGWIERIGGVGAVREGARVSRRNETGRRGPLELALELRRDATTKTTKMFVERLMSRKYLLLKMLKTENENEDEEEEGRRWRASAVSPIPNPRLCMRHPLTTTHPHTPTPRQAPRTACATNIRTTAVARIDTP